MKVTGAKVVAKYDIRKTIKEGQEYEVTSHAKNICVLDNRILISLSDLKCKFDCDREILLN
jgi:hypothetical protein